MEFVSLIPDAIYSYTPFYVSFAGRVFRVAGVLRQQSDNIIIIVIIITTVTTTTAQRLTSAPTDNNCVSTSRCATIGYTYRPVT
jgi:hypothetical protein